MKSINKIIELFSELTSDLMCDKGEILEYLENLKSEKSKNLIRLINDYDDIGNNIMEVLEEMKSDED